MKKCLKLFLFSISFSFLFSCSKATNPCNVIKDSDNFSNLEVFKTEINSGESIVTKNEIIKFNGIDYSLNLSTDYKKENTYFITGNNEYPTGSMISKEESLIVNTDQETSTVKFFVATYVQKEDTIYVSKVISVNVKNGKALKKWVLWVVVPVVMILVSLMVYFTKRYKDKHSS